jgi:hypothetical protein
MGTRVDIHVHYKQSWSALFARSDRSPTVVARALAFVSANMIANRGAFATATAAGTATLRTTRASRKKRRLSQTVGSCP